MSDSDEDFDDAMLWETELEIALLTKCDYGTIRNITKLRAIPANLRSKVWKICLNIQQDIETNEISKWQEVYDLPEQQKIREDCESISEDLYPDSSEDQLSTSSLLESIITFYCKSNDENYGKNNGWLELLRPILTLKLNKNETYNVFNAILKRYIPKDCVQNGSPFHLFRLLMLYHDPELCAFLDTKKISPDSYAHLWFRSLFSSKASDEVTLAIWDMYFQLGDQFLIFFMSLILVFNMREDIMNNTDIDKAELLKTIQAGPTTINVEDLQDFYTLCQHFATKTPQSFRKEYKKALYDGVSLERNACKIYQALCLPVSVDELLQANQLGSGVRYFIIDCRPAEQYNASHYATAFHLDANLMLNDPTEFNQSVEALLAAQKQAINSGSVAGGQHLCFIGSGCDDEDKYVNMVVSNFLQRKINFVSLALGGYEELERAIDDPEMIVGVNVQSRAQFTEDWVKKISNESIPSSTSMLNKFSSVFKKSADLKAKIKDYVGSGAANTSTESANSTAAAAKKQSAKHVSSSDKVGKLYRNQGNLFAIDDTNDEEEEESNKDCVNLELWMEALKPEILSKFKCFYREKIDNKNEWVPGYLLLTKTHLFGLTQRSSSKKGMVEITVRHPLSTIIKIATKSAVPEMLSFSYGERLADKKIDSEAVDAKADNDATTSKTSTKKPTIKKEDSVINNNDTAEYNIKGKDWFYIPDYAGEAASAVKLQVIQIIDLV